MLSDAADLASDQEIQTDVCIVGAGPAGISIAHELRGTDIGVWLLESGGRDVERRAQRLNRGQSVGYPIHRLHQSRVRAFGGTSRHWFSPSDDSWAARPLDPIDFEVRPGIRYSGWPFERAHLDPYYAHAQALCRLGPFVYDPAHWADEGTGPDLPLRLGDVETTLFQRGRHDFNGYYDGLVRAPNVTLLLHAPRSTWPPTRIPAGWTESRSGARTAPAASFEHDWWCSPPVGSRTRGCCCSAAGCIERGLGNDRDLVGRFFAERLSARSGYVVPATPGLAGSDGVLRGTGGTRRSGAEGAAGIRRGATRAAAPQLRILFDDPKPVHDGRSLPVARDPGQGRPAVAAAGRHARPREQRRDRPH